MFVFWSGAVGEGYRQIYNMIHKITNYVQVTNSGQMEGSYDQCTDHFSFINNEELAYRTLTNRGDINYMYMQNYHDREVKGVRDYALLDS